MLLPSLPLASMLGSALLTPGLLPASRLRTASGPGPGALHPNYARASCELARPPASWPTLPTQPTLPACPPAPPPPQYCDWASNVKCAAVDYSPAPTPSPSPKPSTPPGPSPSPLPPYSPTPFTGNGIYAVYYDTWSDPWKGTAATHTLAKLPAYVNMVILAFM